MLLRSCLRVRSLRGLQLGLQQQIRKGHDHGPLMPPFARSGPITGKLPEEIELMWDDSVAPETCVDFDAPHVDTQEMFTAWGAMASFFLVVMGLVSWSNPEKKNPVATRKHVIPKETRLVYLQGIHAEVESNDEDEDEEDEH